MDLRSRVKSGALLAPLLTLPAAALVGLVWRFPVPMGEYASGVEALILAPLAMIFYLLFGGFIVIPLLGAALTLGAVRVLPMPVTDEEPATGPDWAVRLGAGGAALAVAFFLAGLELIIGPW